jgi:hypothetical protein
MEKIHLTRKIQLLIDSSDPDFIYQSRGQIMAWQNACYRCANLVYTHQFIQEQIKDMVYLTEGIKLRVTDQSKDPDGMLTSSRTNSTYKVLTQHFKGLLPSNIYNNLNNTLVGSFSQDKVLYHNGERSIRNFKKDMAMPFSGECLRKLTEVNEGAYFTFTLFGIPLKTYLGRTFDDKREMLREVIRGNYKLAISYLKLEDKKLYLLATFEQDRQVHLLSDDVVAEASLSLEHPLTVKIGKIRLTIGNKEEFLYRRLAIQAARRRVQASHGLNRAGHGKKRKQKPLEHYKHMERDYVEYKLQVYSRRLIDFCVKNQAATLILTGQLDKEEAAKRETFVLRNWSYGQLKDKIAYKADKAGINLIVE